MSESAPISTPANPATSAPPAFERLSKREFTIVIAGLMLALMLASLDQNIVGTALPRIVSDLGGLTHISWVVTAFVLTSTVSTPLYGKLSDMYGRKKLFHVSIVIFLVGSILCGFAQSMVQLILFRAIQGVGAGGLMPLAQTAMGDVIEPRERGKYQGLFTGVFAFCSVAGPLLGGVITVALSWRWIFFVNLPVGAVAMALIERGLRRPHRATSHKVDYPGAALLTVGTTALLLMLSWGGAVYAWDSTIILAMIVAAVALGVGFVARQAVAQEPILPLRLFRIRVFSISCSAMGLNTMALFGAAVFMSLYFQLVMGDGPAVAGLRLTPLMGGVIVSSIVGGRLVSRTGRYKWFLVGGLFTSMVAFGLLAWAATARWDRWTLEACLVGVGLGVGLAMPNLTLSTQNAVDRSDLGVATSTLGFFRSLGGAIGVALSGAILTMGLHELLPPEVMTGGVASALDQGAAKIATLSPAAHDMVIEAYRHAIVRTFYAGGTFSGIAFLVSLGLPNTLLRGRGGH
ncbi:MAG TPA: MDR family MFS transporter [Magnetospirillaceae bacterium]|jgi:EmrB/QacA subfamily drug resistance transporter